MRIVLIVLLLLLCVYVIVQLYRLRRMPAPPSARDNDPLYRDIDRFTPDLSSTLDAKYGVMSSEEVDTHNDAVVSLSGGAPIEEEEPPPRATRPQEPDASSFGFDALLEVRQMRHLVDEQRDRLMQLSEEVYTLREELAAVRAASRVSPAYAEAVSLMRSGYDAQAVAERCGISVAEAELVRALSQGQTDQADDITGDRHA
ncbi:DUF2802 domain-containing protein [Viridibacterium curvum]|uniref:DUF2802 domain-containing protein n=1 Tax=Viridibacterium curvum TaxID=1101404 RepID=A0ABP9R3U7_9RHOO